MAKNTNDSLTIDAMLSDGCQRRAAKESDQMTNEATKLDLTDADLACIIEAYKLATSGNWEFATNPDDCDIKELYDNMLDSSDGKKLWFATVDNGEICTAMCGNGPNASNNAWFVCVAHAAIPVLVREHIALRGMVKQCSKNHVWRGVPSDFLILPLIFEDKDEGILLAWMSVEPSSEKGRYLVRFQIRQGEDDDFEPFDTESREGLKNALDCAELIAKQLGFVRDFDTIERPEAAK